MWFRRRLLPKRVKALIYYGQQHGYPLCLIKAVMDINNDQPRRVLQRLNTHFPSLENVEITVVGLALKPCTDNMRELPAIPIVKLIGGNRSEDQRL